MLVVGGGLIGATAALAAANLGWRVAVLERRRPQRQRGRLGMDLRTVALAPATRALLADLNLWPGLTAAPYRAMRVWEERGAGEIRFDANEVGLGELGWIVEVSELSVELWERLEGCPTVTRLVGEDGVRLKAHSDRVDADVAGQVLSARLVVVADGARSSTREQFGVGVTNWKTDQVAIATIARTAKPHAGTACQCFLLDGPLALLPGVEAHTVSVVWSQPAASAERRQALTEAAFRQELAAAAGHCHGEILDVDRRLSFQISQALAQTLNPHPRVLVVGDAARAIHPLAGLGVNLGFEDVSALLAGLPRATDQDPGAAGRWRAFARRRKARGLAMLGFLAGLRGFYGLGGPLPNWLRNTGVRLVHGARPVKRQLIREALGFGPIARQLRQGNA